MELLTTIDLNNALGNDPAFLGTWAINQMPKPPLLIGKVKMVVNLQPNNLPGSHWVAIFRRDSGFGYYFDSFGSIPPLAIQRWMHNNCNTWTWNRQTIQPSNNDVLCGYLCIEFLKRL